MSEIDPRLVAAARRVSDLTSADEILSTAGDLFNEIGEDATCLIGFANHARPLIQPGFLVDLARSVRARRNDPRVGPMLDLIKASTLAPATPGAAWTFIIAKMELARELALQLGFPPDRADAEIARLRAEIARE